MIDSLPRFFLTFRRLVGEGDGLLVTAVILAAAFISTGRSRGAKAYPSASRPDVTDKSVTFSILNVDFRTTGAGAEICRSHVLSAAVG